MTNEFNVKLDRNGYAPSIIPWSPEHCIICQRTGHMQRHEIFHGSLYRERSKNLGLWVNICPECHRKLHNTEPWMDKALKKVGQDSAMHRYRWSVKQFREHFGKNYLEGFDE